MSSCGSMVDEKYKVRSQACRRTVIAAGVVTCQIFIFSQTLIVPPPAPILLECHTQDYKLTRQGIELPATVASAVKNAEAMEQHVTKIQVRQLGGEWGRGVAIQNTQKPKSIGTTVIL